MNYLGIDIAKAKVDCCLKLAGRYLHRTFANNTDGFAKLVEWVGKHGNGPVHACLEATGIYGEAVAVYLHDAGHIVSIINPLVIKKYIEMKLIAVKTDKQDARNIADFCCEQKPKAYTFPSESERILKNLTRHLQYLTDMQTAQINRAKVAHTVAKHYIDEMLQHIQKQMAEVEAEIARHIQRDESLRHKAKLLQSIRGIGKRTVPHLLTLFVSRKFKNAKQVVSYIGLNPILKQSGKQKTRYCAVSKQGDKHIRTSLYMPAVVCFRLPEFKAYIQRLENAGKKKMQIVCALMRKLITYCFAVLSKDKAFELHGTLTLSSIG